MKTEQRREVWQRRVAEQEQSGSSVREFCKKHGLAEQAFYSWRRRLRTIGGPVTFALVEPKLAIPEGVMLELVMAQGERLRIPCEAAALRMVIGILRGGL